MPKRTDIKKILIIGSGPIVVLLGCLLIASTVFSRPSVEVLMPRPSSQSAKIAVLHDGIPLQNVRVAVSNADGKTCASLSTDEHGTVVLPFLPPGRYTISAKAPGRLQAYLLLDISKHTNKKSSEFSMWLSAGPPSFEEQIAGAEAKSSPDHVKEFNGTVVDPSGAEIPKVKIDIYQRGSNGKMLVSTLLADATGHFAAHLRDGAYNAVFQAQGFATKIHVFEVDADSGPKETWIRLDVGPVT